MTGTFLFAHGESVQTGVVAGEYSYPVVSLGFEISFLGQSRLPPPSEVARIALQAKRGQSGRPVVVDLGVDLIRPNRGKMADPVVYRGEPGNGSPRSVGLRRE